MNINSKTSFITFLMVLMVHIPSSVHAKLNIVTTVPDLAAIAQAVGGDRVEVVSLSLPTQDPHFVDARPHLMLKLNRADLLLLVGLDLETGWLPTLTTGARNAKILPGSPGYIDCSTFVELKEVPLTKIDRSMGDIHAGGNPHYLLDVDNVARIADGIALHMGKLDASAASLYRDNAKRFMEEARRRKMRWQEQFKPYRGTAIVEYHRSWIYLASFLGLRIVADVEPKPGIPPSASHVLHVMQTIRQEHVPLVLQEDFFSSRTAELIAQKTGASLVRLAIGTRFSEGETYFQRMETILEQIVSAMKRAQSKSR